MDILSLMQDRDRGLEAERAAHWDSFIGTAQRVLEAKRVPIVAGEKNGIRLEYGNSWEPNILEIFPGDNELFSKRAFSPGGREIKNVDPTRDIESPIRGQINIRGVSKGIDGSDSRCEVKVGGGIDSVTFFDPQPNTD